MLEPQVEETPAAVADAPDTTTTKTMHEDPTKLDQSGDEAAEKKSGSARGSSSKPSGSRAAKAAPKTETPSSKASASKGSTPKASTRKKKDES